jgi:hypothetical protein
MTSEEFAALRINDIVVGKASGLGYIVIAKAGSGYIAQRTLHITNPEDWTLIKPPLRKEYDHG